MDISEITDLRLKRRILDQWAAEDQNRRLAQSAKLECGPENEQVAPDARESSNAVRRFARITYRCFRCRSLDDENPCTKFFTDALRFAGAIFDDSKEWAKIEVIECPIARPGLEWTEIEIEYLDNVEVPGN